MLFQGTQTQRLNGSINITCNSQEIYSFGLDTQPTFQEGKKPNFHLQKQTEEQSQRTSRALLEMPSALNKNIKQRSVHTHAKYWKAKMWGQRAKAAPNTWDGQQPLTLLTPPTPVQQQVKQNGHFSAMRVKENTKVPWWSVLLKLQLFLYSCCQQFHWGLRSRTSSLTTDLEPRGLKPTWF